jgi:cation:H+ antiporter
VTLLPILGLLALGTGLLYLGARWLVDGAAGLARALGVRPLVVGLTVVAYATSAPELVVSVVASLQGRGPIALGNVIGSNIANVGLILGTTALLSPPRAAATLARRELLVLIAATAALPVLVIDGVLGRGDAMLLLLGSVAFTVVTVRSARRDPDPAERPLPRGRLRLAGLAAVGLLVLLAGGEVFVSGAIRLALRVGISERVVGLTIVAAGTSLPELAASIVATTRGHSDLAIGNVVGSNVFNLLLVLGAAGVLAPIGAPLGDIAIDLAFMGALALAAVGLLWREKPVSRTAGALLLAGYAAFLVTTVQRG